VSENSQISGGRESLLPKNQIGTIFPRGWTIMGRGPDLGIPEEAGHENGGEGRGKCFIHGRRENLIRLSTKTFRKEGGKKGPFSFIEAAVAFIGQPFIRNSSQITRKARMR